MQISIIKNKFYSILNDSITTNFHAISRSNDYSSISLIGELFITAKLLLSDKYLTNNGKTYEILYLSLRIYIYDRTYQQIESKILFHKQYAINTI